jgi:hypothetical protein
MTDAEILAFRSHFPEFTDETLYPDAQIVFWSGIGTARLNVIRWDTLLTHGIELLTAHYLVIAVRNAKSADGGNIPGGAAGVSNKAIGGASIGYDTAATNLEDAGNFNLTTYGREFIKLARIVGIAGLQI